MLEDQENPDINSAPESGEKNNEEMLQIKRSEYEKLNNELAECKDKTIRLYAEFDNARKRMDRDKIEFVKFANEKMVTEFLNILDDLERSVIVAQEKHQNYESFLKGVEMIMARILDMLKKNGVKSMDVKPGMKFDPNCHEVLMQQDTKDFEDGAVMEEFQKGYFLGDKVVRTAKVKVAKNT